MEELFKSCRQRETVRYNEAIFDLLVIRNEGMEKLQIQNKGKDIMILVSLFFKTKRGGPTHIHI